MRGISTIPLCAQGQRAESVQERTFRTAPPGCGLVEVMRAPVAGYFRILSRHLLVDVHLPRGEGLVVGPRGKRMRRWRGTVRSTGHTKPDRAPPLLDDDAVAGVPGHVVQLTTELRACRMGAPPLDPGEEWFVQREGPVQHDVVLTMNPSGRGLLELPGHEGVPAGVLRRPQQRDRRARWHHLRQVSAGACLPGGLGRTGGPARGRTGPRRARPPAPLGAPEGSLPQPGSGGRSHPHPASSLRLSPGIPGR